jgi:hypothetical protein
MFFDGYIAAPPTITVLSFAIEGPTKDAVIISAASAPAESNEIRFDMGHLLYESKWMPDAEGCKDCTNRSAIAASVSPSYGVL